MENRRLRAQVDRLRRLLGEAEARYGGAVGTTPLSESTGRNLPDIRRSNPFRRG
jgi:hypothetical protein